MKGQTEASIVTVLVARTVTVASCSEAELLLMEESPLAEEDCSASLTHPGAAKTGATEAKERRRDKLKDFMLAGLCRQRGGSGEAWKKGKDDEDFWRCG